MTKQENTVTWVVFLKTIHKRPHRISAVCEQSEWDAMELARPGYHQLIRGGIATEVEAEMLARAKPIAEAGTQVRRSRCLTRPEQWNSKSSQREK